MTPPPHRLLAHLTDLQHPLHVPATGNLHLRDARFDGATFSDAAVFDCVTFRGDVASRRS
jgi:hypothetical protein